MNWFAKQKPFLFVMGLCFYLFPVAATAFDDPTQGKPFVPWLWEDQFYPTIKEGGSRSSLYVLTGGVAVSAYSFSQDDYGQDFARHAITKDQAEVGSKLGSGLPGVSVAVIQLFLDQQNGLAHGRALSLTALTHISIAATVQRERPNKSPTKLSFPSGHASSIFATATSLAYAYGPIVGTVAYTAATWNAISRVREEAHYVSDVVAGAAIGFYWGRASALAGRKQIEEESSQLMPVPIEGGAQLVWLKDF